MKKSKAWIIIVPFIVALFSISLINIQTKAQKISQVENRYLAQRPDFSINRAATGDYFTKFETYFADQFVERDQLISSYTNLQIAKKEPVVNDYHITKDNWIIQQIPKTYDTQMVDKNAKRLIDFSKVVEGQNSEFYMVLTPRKINSLFHLYPKYMAFDTFKNVKKQFKNTLVSNDVNVLDMGEYFSKTFTKKEMESFYFKTDHHWNSNGAFEGFQFIVQSLAQSDKSIPSNTIVKSNYREVTVKGKKFLGSENQQLYKLVKTDDIPKIISPKDTGSIQFYLITNKENKASIKSIISPGINKAEVTYADIYTRDLPDFKMVNPKAKINQKILVLKDSYFNPMTLLFAEQFREVRVLDIRHLKYKTAEEIVKEYKPNKTLVLYNDAQGLIGENQYMFNILQGK